MGSWDYTNIGVWTAPAYRKYVKKIFEYIGYAPEPDYAEDGEPFNSDIPDVYGCMKTDSYLSEQINIKEPFQTYSPSLAATNLLNLLNALFPVSKVCIHTATGSNTNDIWETKNEIYNTNDLICYESGSDCANKWGPFPRNHFSLGLPWIEQVQALIDISKEDKNIELTEMLTSLLQRIKCALDSPEFQADIITLGSYPQTTNSKNNKAPIDWFVLDKNGSNVLVISRYGLNVEQYHSNRNRPSPKLSNTATAQHSGKRT